MNALRRALVRRAFIRTASLQFRWLVQPLPRGLLVGMRQDVVESLSLDTAIWVLKLLIKINQSEKLG